ncbi:hypothetical protein BCV69DRAFT_283790 [Microstroma glucosiphilum]|uniref:Uncharacterized protein n=1 Tax=Pseudomicrostroma glucosiphilum TaxID=1684307 RepID=A0A316U4G7_9BASI|nr:hypothetical protein BCV69DRAFT_283790 [Pseudomicrostroma glucosiphilum]PWN19684.1 hypothetical protein BCV69DRAFT_283790 [Pseudomicrostroma glucosiphilum]
MSIPPGNLPSGTGRPLGQPSPGLGSFGAGRGGAGGPSAGSMGANFPFGAAGSGAFSQNQSLQQQSQGNLDLSDFPALGAGNSHQGQAEWGQASNLASSLGGVGSRAGANVSAGGSAAQAGGSFSNDDFPALGAATQQNANGGVAQAAAAAEQASAAAALQHQASQREAHRMGLLSGVNGSPQTPNRAAGSQGQPQALNAARGGFGDMDRVSSAKDRACCEDRHRVTSR